MSQNLRTAMTAAAHDGASIRIGLLVRARGACWRVQQVDAYAACRIVRLAPMRGPQDAMASLALVVPFDRVTPVERAARWRERGLARTMARVAGALRDTVAGGAGHLLGPDLSLVPWQWAPATALLHGDASALLLADAVGLGKTIQAGITIAALRARGDASRVLILTPAGLRDQWQAEVERLFRFRAGIVDAAWLRHTRRTIPADVNPWSVTPTAIASIDFVKQPEVLAAATEAPWDMLIVDEAHTLGVRTDRRAAAAALAACARHVLLLTATPHAGSDEEFAALCGVGALAGDDGQMLVMRRTRADVGLDAARRVRVSRVALGAAERRMHALLREYARAVWDGRGTRSPTARLAMTVLLKRAASSAWALGRSVAHRVRLLGSGDDLPAQRVLPFDEPGETDDGDVEMPGALGEPGLEERGRELQLLAAVGEAARLAAAFESKLARVSTLLRRTREPAVVFTEYRDTLDAALRALGAHGPVAVLHGGLSRVERREAERAFTTGRARVLLATDVASEGLNLHHGCRLVINLELPWSPVRLEQRVGRVDRLGQRRRVHAVHLIARDTPEAYVLERLAARERNIRRSLGDTYGGTGVTDMLLAADALGAPATDVAHASAATRACSTWSPADRDEHRLCELLDGARRLTGASRGSPAHRRGENDIPVTTVRPRLRARLGLEPGVVLAFRVQAMSAAGRPAEAAIIAIHVALSSIALSRARSSTILAAVLPMAGATALRERAGALATGLQAHRLFTARAAAREAALQAVASGLDGRPQDAAVQPGLFDRRAEHRAARQRAAHEHRRQLHATRLARLALETDVEESPIAEPLFALVLR